MIKIKSLHLKNFRGFSDFSIDFSDKITCIAGINGSGKSSILKASSECIFWIIEQIIPKRNKVILIDKEDVSVGAATAKMNAVVQGDSNRNLDIEIESKTISKRAQAQKTSVIKNEEARRYFSSLRANPLESENKPLPVLIYYPCNRSDLKMLMKLPKQAEDFSNKYKTYDNALEAVAKFDDFFIWFRDREDRENAEKLRLYDNGEVGKKYSDSYLDAVRKAISSFVPGFDTIKIVSERNKMVATKNKQEINISNLSDGEKGIIVLFGDIARRLAMANPNSKNPLKGDGIILIDEIELHLHPEWQRKIVPALTKTFPNCQFIITTHSPQVLGEIEPENIRLLDNFEVSTPKQSYGLDSNSVLAQLMNNDSKTPITINAEIDKKIHDISLLIDKENFKEAKEQLEKLEKKLHGSTPDTLSLSTAITMLEGGE